MSNQPNKWIRFRGIKPAQNITFIHGANSVNFDGPDREANARKFVHMDELVNTAAGVAELIIRNADIRAELNNQSDCLENLFVLIAKIEGQS